MTAARLRHRTQVFLEVPLWGWALFAATAGWAALVIVGYLRPGVVPDPRLLAFAGPLVLCAAVALTRNEAPGPLRLAAGCSATVGGSLLITEYAVVNPVLAIALPLIAIIGMLAYRRPVGAMIAAFVFTGTYASVGLFTPLPGHGLADLTLAALWAATVWSFLFSERKRSFVFWPGVALVGLYLLVTFLQALAVDDLQRGLFAFRFSAWYMAAFLLIAYSGQSPETLRKAARAALVVVAVVAGYAVFRWVFGPAAREAAAFGQSPYNYVDGELRAIGSFQSGHAMSIWMAPMAAFSLAMALSVRGRWQAVAYAAFGLAVLALLATEVRSGLLALIAGLVVVLVLYQLSRGFAGPHLGVTAAAVVCAVGLTAGAFTVAIDSDTTRDRFAVLTTPERDPAFQARLEKWREAMKLTRDAPLGNGLGFSGNAEDQYRRFRTVASLEIDNSYLKVLLDQGIFVVLLLVAAWLLVLYDLVRRALLTRDRRAAGVAIGAAGALSAFLVICAGGPYLEGLPAVATWIVAGLGIGQFASRDEVPE